MNVDQARNITKLAGQVNESMYAEVKVARTKLDLGEAADAFGSLRLGNEE